MTFAVTKIKDDQRQDLGTLWVDDKSYAEALAPLLWGASSDERFIFRRTDDREIPLQLAKPALHLC